MLNASPLHPMLILECDTPGLEEQGLSLARRLQALAQTRLGAHVPTFQTTDLVSWMHTHRNLSAFRAELLVLMGHGSRSGLRLAEDATGLTPWGLISDRLRPLRPTRIVVIAGAHARNTDPGPMFGALPTLQEVIGCPLYLDEQRLAQVLAALPHVPENAAALGLHRQRRGDCGVGGPMGLRMNEYAFR